MSGLHSRYEPGYRRGHETHPRRGHRRHRDHRGELFYAGLSGSATASRTRTMVSTSSATSTISPALRATTWSNRCPQVDRAPGPCASRRPSRRTVPRRALFLVGEFYGNTLRIITRWSTSTPTACGGTRFRTQNGCYNEYKQRHLWNQGKIVLFVSRVALWIVGENPGSIKVRSRSHGRETRGSVLGHPPEIRSMPATTWPGARGGVMANWACTVARVTWEQSPSPIRLCAQGEDVHLDMDIAIKPDARGIFPPRCRAIT